MAGALPAPPRSASAAPPPTAGAQGHEAGCRFAANGDYGDDSLLLLTSEEVSTFVTGCIFTTIRPQGEGAFLIDVLCSHEGEEYKTTGTMRIEKVAGADAYSIVDEDGSQWGAVGPCD